MLRDVSIYHLILIVFIIFTMFLVALSEVVMSLVFAWLLLGELRQHQPGRGHLRVHLHGGGEGLLRRRRPLLPPLRSPVAGSRWRL